LEEEDGKSKRVNVKSSKRLQSGGWSKGFLNNTKKKSAPKKSAPKKKEANTTKASAEPNRAKSERPSENKSRVSFSNDNKIKEIPRIGQSKVPPRPAKTSSTPARPLADFHPTSANNNLQDPEDDINSPFSSVSPSFHLKRMSFEEL